MYPVLPKVLRKTTTLWSSETRFAEVMFRILQQSSIYRHTILHIDELMMDTEESSINIVISELYSTNGTESNRIRKLCNGS